MRLEILRGLNAVTLKHTGMSCDRAAAETLTQNRVMARMAHHIIVMLHVAAIRIERAISIEGH